MNSKGSIFLIFIACICSLSIAGCGNKYKNNYIKNPHVSVFVKEHRSQKVTVVGEVENPGTYDYPSRQRLVDALAIAGGLTESAGQIVHIRRLSSVSEVSSQDSVSVRNGYVL